MKKIFTSIPLIFMGILIFTMLPYATAQARTKSKPVSFNEKINDPNTQQLEILRIQERQQKHLQEISTSLKKLTSQESLQRDSYSYP